MEHDIPGMTVSPQVQEAGDHFAKLATEFCQLVDGRAEVPLIDFMIRMERLLARIYLEASELPVIDLPSELVDLRFNESLNNSKLAHNTGASEFHERMRLLASYLGKYNRYWQIVDPLYDADHEPTEYSIAGDLSEIYDDLNNRLDRWQNGNPTQKSEAYHEWRLHWKIHWGDHALNAIRAIHEHVEDCIDDTDADEMELRNKILMQKSGRKI